MISSVKPLRQFLFIKTLTRNMSTLLERMNQKWERGVITGELVVLNTSITYMKQNDCNFLIRLLKDDGFKRKSSNIKPCSTKIDDPFCPENRNQELIVNTFEKHTLMLNKFPVMKNHSILVTNEFESQCSPLTIDDFKAVTEVLSSIPSLVFYNCGLDSGASQPHKHIQLIPYSQFEEESTPFDKLMENEDIKEGKIDQCRFYGFDNAICSISFSSLNGMSVEDRARVLLTKYNMLLDDITRKKQSRNQFLTSYNFVILSKWMLLVPRSRETWKNINVNSLGFTGSFLVKNSEMLQQLEEMGPLTVLKNVVN